MVSRKSHLVFWALSAAFVVVLSALPVLAQDDEQDPDPNSPTPILLSMEGSTRALAAPATRGFGKTSFVKVIPTAFAPGSKINLYVTDLDLVKGEGASALRVYAEDKNGHLYRFPVLQLQQVPGKEWIYALTVKLTDEIGYWEPPAPDGDLLIGVTWRGLASNLVKLGYGATGGLKDDTNAVPTPASKFQTKAAIKSEPSSPDAWIGYRFAGDRIRFLEQAAFGPSVMDDSRIRRIGIRSWLADQFSLPYPSINNPYPNQPLKPGNAPADCNGDPMGDTVPDVPPTCFRDTYTMYPAQTWFMREALYSDSQLRLRVAWALSQMWVTSGVDIQQSRHMVEYFKILERNAFGNYRTLMKEMSLSPTMGDYLDMARSTKNNPNENYGRELMQLFTVGLFMLNQDGTQLRDGSNNPIPTYDQNTVNNMTKVLTGWSFCQTQGATCPNVVVGSLNFIDPMLLNQTQHDVTAKTLLSYPGAVNQNIASGLNGNTELDLALDNIFYHPNVAPFVSKTLIQHLVTSDPTPAYVGRVAAVFNNNGFGMRGDLKAVVRAILLDPEARGDIKTDPNYGKLREPVQLVTNVLRTFNVHSADGLSQSDGVFVGRGDFNGMAQVPFMSPTVFNFYPPSYVVPGTTLLGPEFALMTTGTSIQRANFMNTIVFNRINVALPNIPNGTSIDLTEMQSLLAADPSGNLLMDTLNQRMLNGSMSSSMRSTILNAVLNGGISATDTLGRTKQAIYLVATSSQYQVQR